MQLVITSYGSSLKRRGAMFAVRTDAGEKRIAAQKVESIWIATGAMLTTDAIALALERNIDVVFLNKFGDPIGRVWQPRLGSTAAIRRAQLRLSMGPDGAALALGWVRGKLRNQVAFLRKLRDRRTRISAEITKAIHRIEASAQALEGLQRGADELRSQIMGLEGSAGRAYFGALALLVPQEHRFEGRSRNPAQDAFNCFLNYAYGVLYSLVERACILAGLDPCLGFLHTDNYAKPSLVFDLIEPYRIWAEEAVMELFVQQKIEPDEQLRQLENGVLLDRPGKALLMDRYGRFLDERIAHRGRKVTRRHSLQLDAHRLAQELLAWEPADRSASGDDGAPRQEDPPAVVAETLWCGSSTTSVQTRRAARWPGHVWKPACSACRSRCSSAGSTATASTSCAS